MRYILILLFCISINLQAQEATKEVNITWGKEAERSKGSYLKKIVLKNEKGWIALRQKKAPSSLYGKYWLEAFNRNMEKVKSVELELKEKDATHKMFHDVIVLQEKMYLVSSYYNIEKQTSYLFAQFISKDLEVSSDLILLSEEKTTEEKPIRGFAAKMLAGAIKDKDFMKYKFRVSKDRSKFMVFNSSVRLGSTNTHFSFKVFDESMNFIYKKEDDFEQKDDFVFLNDFIVAENGDVYLKGKSTLLGLGMRHPNKLGVLVYSNLGIDKQRVTFDISKQFNSSSMKLTEAGNLAVYGLYSDNPKSLATGAFFFEVDTKEGKILNQKTKKLAFQPEAISKKKKKEKTTFGKVMTGTETGASLVHLTTKDLLVKKDGSVILIAEKRYRTTETRRDRNNYVTSYSFSHFEDLFLISFAKNGDVEWLAELPKRQKVAVGRENFGSCSVDILNNEVVVLYNEHQKFFEEENPKKQRQLVFNGKLSNLAVAHIDENGTVNKYTLSTIKGHDVLLNSTTFWSEDSAIFIGCEKKDAVRFGKVE